MTYSIEQIKGEISSGGGIAKGNLYRVILPVIPSLFLNQNGLSVATPQSLNVLCKSASMPGRQLLTHDRTVGAVNQKIAYGYANDDVSLTFMGLNNYTARKYFEDWQFYAMDQDTHEVRYKDEYAKNVIIQQLDHQHKVVYSVQLEDAFPTQVLNIDFSNENGQPIEVSVTLSYTRWRRNNVIRDAISDVAQDFLEDLLLRN